MRLFVAIELEDSVRESAAGVQQSLRRTCDGVRWVRPELLHLTVKFLGEVPDADVAGVCEAVSRAAGTAEPFELAVSGCGCFPQRGRVRVVWIGGAAGDPAMLSCVSAVEDELEALGFPRESRPFSPHITLGRVNADRSGGKIRDAVQAASVSPASQEVRSVVVMSSVLSPTGPTYDVVSRAEFGTRPSSGSES